jgi:glycosyltransferase involved in cell wall biosynthesis
MVSTEFAAWVSRAERRLLARRPLINRPAERFCKPFATIASMKRLSRNLLRYGRSAFRLLFLGLDRYRRGADLVMPSASRAERSQADQVTPPPGAVFDVIYSVGCWPGESKRYRVFNMAEGLRAAGYSVHVLSYSRIADIIRNRWVARALVLFRAEYDPLVGISDVLAYARASGIRVVFDIDDLLFDKTLAGCIDGLQQMGRFERRWFIASLARYRRLMLSCDSVTVTTAPLAHAVEAAGRPAVIVPNGLNATQLRLAENIAARQPPADGTVRIGYFSGSRTHQRDFANCEPALLELMAGNPLLRLRLVGYLDLGSAWRGYGDRVERLSFRSPADLLRSVAETDINLAPLEIGNPFCEAKSELKFFEAALVGVPTIASATEPFVAAIEDGVSGFLARGYDDWRRALETLVVSPERRQVVGRAARERALLRYAPRVVIPQAIAALGLPPRT